MVLLRMTSSMRDGYRWRVIRKIPNFEESRTNIIIGVARSYFMPSFCRALTPSHNSGLYNSSSSSSRKILKTETYGTTSKKMYHQQKIDTFLVVGLGNHPYPDTRHSVGMEAVDHFACRLGLQSQWQRLQGRNGGLMCKTVTGLNLNSSHDGETCRAEIVLFKPKALMNVNGGNVAKIAQLHGVRADKIYLMHDELDMEPGKCSLKNGGSARGHRGVQSCISSLKPSGLWSDEASTQYKALPRLRIGIGRPALKSDVVPYVLSPFPAEDFAAISKAINSGIDLLLSHIAGRVLLALTAEASSEANEDTKDET